MTNDPPAKTHLHEALSQLEPLCRRLWDDNSPVALGLQAFMEEFGGESQRLEQLLEACLKSLHDQQEKLAGERVKTEALQTELRAKEEENADIHHKFLKIETAHDEERAKKMEAFYAEVNAKSAGLEASWEARRKTLEEEFTRRNAALQRKEEENAESLEKRVVELERNFVKQDGELAKARDRMTQELTTWEENKRLKDEALLAREKELTLHEFQLKEEYARKQSEFQVLKQGLQREVAEIVKQYQSKLRHEGQVHPPAPTKAAPTR